MKTIAEIINEGADLGFQVLESEDGLVEITHSYRKFWSLYSINGLSWKKVVEDFGHECFSSGMDYVYHIR